MQGHFNGRRTSAGIDLVSAFAAAPCSAPPGDSDYANIEIQAARNAASTEILSWLTAAAGPRSIR